MLRVKALASNKCLLGEIIYLQNEKFKSLLHDHFTKKQKITYQNNNDNNKEDTNSLLLLILCELLRKTVVLTYVFKNVNFLNDSRVSRRYVGSCSSQYVLDGSIQNTCISCIIICRNAK